MEKRVTGPDGKRQHVLVAEDVFIEPAAAESSTEIEAKLGVKDGAIIRFSTTEKPKD
ncbi:MAG: hypothetical protein U9Q81_20775 [Pseudomonadota bacterium]|nr:hypothetical protein [Pseudomonadota bacterium]